jgi:hypothetical protein
MLMTGLALLATLARTLKTSNPLLEYNPAKLVEVPGGGGMGRPKASGEKLEGEDGGFELKKEELEER